MEGSGAAKTSGPWPARANRAYYLRNGGGLSPSPPPPGEAPAVFTFDPSRPVPTIAGAMTSIFELAPLGELARSPWSGFIPTRARMRSLVTEGAADQKEQPGLFACLPPFPRLSQLADVLVFQTPPLPEEVELTGHLTARLWISSSAPDTDFTVKLLDVYPPNPDYPEGYDLNLADGILRVRYRNGFETEELMRPGEVYAIEIELPPTSNCFQAGHRIRVDVSSSNFPRFDVNPNTGEPTGRHTRSQPARNRVYLDSRPALASHPARHSEESFPMKPLHRHTPLWESRPLGARLGARVWLKLEALQPTGSFKIRGVGHACQSAPLGWGSGPGGLIRGQCRPCRGLRRPPARSAGHGGGSRDDLEPHAGAAPRGRGPGHPAGGRLGRLPWAGPGPGAPAGGGIHPPL